MGRVGVGVGVGGGELGSSMVIVAWAPRMIAFVGGRRLTVNDFGARRPRLGVDRDRDRLLGLARGEGE